MTADQSTSRTPYIAVVLLTLSPVFGALAWLGSAPVNENDRVPRRDVYKAEEAITRAFLAAATSVHASSPATVDLPSARGREATALPSTP